MFLSLPFLIYQMNKESIIHNLQKKYFFLKDIPVQWRNNKDIVLVAIETHNGSFISASKNLKNDKDVTLKAVSMDGSLLFHASDAMKDDKDIVIQAIKNWGPSIAHASDRLQNDKEMALIAVSMPGKAFFYIHEKFKNDKDVLLVALKKDMISLFYASDDLQNDIDLLTLLKNNYTNYTKTEPYLSWYNTRMQILDILEDEQWMRTHVLLSTTTTSPPKF